MPPSHFRPLVVIGMKSTKAPLPPKSIAISICTRKTLDDVTLSPNDATASFTAPHLPLTMHRNTFVIAIRGLRSSSERKGGKMEGSTGITNCHARLTTLSGNPLEPAPIRQRLCPFSFLAESFTHANLGFIRNQKVVFQPPNAPGAGETDPISGLDPRCLHPTHSPMPNGTECCHSVCGTTGARSNYRPLLRCKVSMTLLWAAAFISAKRQFS